MHFFFYIIFGVGEEIETERGLHITDWTMKLCNFI